MPRRPPPAHASSTVNVAVIDSGIYLQHSDLNAVSGKNCINTSQPARDDNGMARTSRAASLRRTTARA
jgi:hypothetical protein